MHVVPNNLQSVLQSFSKFTLWCSREQIISLKEPKKSHASSPEKITCPQESDDSSHVGKPTGTYQHNGKHRTASTTANTDKFTQTCASKHRPDCNTTGFKNHLYLFYSLKCPVSLTTLLSIPNKYTAISM